MVLSARIAAASSAFRKMEGKSTRIGTYKCYQCRKPFTVKIGTIFEASHVKLNHLATGDLPYRFVQEGHFEQPASPHPWRDPEDRLVHVASHP